MKYRFWRTTHSGQGNSIDVPAHRGLVPLSASWDHDGTFDHLTVIWVQELPEPTQD
jgi:hypothetical protein